MGELFIRIYDVWPDIPWRASPACGCASLPRRPERPRIVVVMPQRASRFAPWHLIDSRTRTSHRDATPRKMRSLQHRRCPGVNCGAGRRVTKPVLKADGILRTALHAQLTAQSLSFLQGFSLIPSGAALGNSLLAASACSSSGEEPGASGSVSGGVSGNGSGCSPGSSSGGSGGSATGSIVGTVCMMNALSGGKVSHLEARNSYSRDSYERALPVHSCRRRSVEILLARDESFNTLCIQYRAR